MSAKGLSRWFFIAALAGTITLLAIWTAPAQAQSQAPQAEPECVSCHENIYFLHDTGKWFCLNEETPMTCVGCHGGDPAAASQDLAHVNRAAHPIVNENISKCSECHPEQSIERVEIFARNAGVSKIMVSQPYQLANPIAVARPIPVTGNIQNSNWLTNIGRVTFISVIGLAVTAYVSYRIRHRRKARP